LKRIRAEVVAWLKVLESSALYATIIVTFGIQVARVEGQSMDPTLKDQDRLVVNKLAYQIGEPRPGDIVMMRYPADPDKSFVKRLIAREGDTVHIVNGQVRVNGRIVPAPYVSGEHQSHDDWGPDVIPAGYCFVLGDNRSNSSDSRVFGFVPSKYIIAKVQLRWWPLSAARLF
jgi:signal peptidase I